MIDQTTRNRETILRYFAAREHNLDAVDAMVLPNCPIHNSFPNLPPGPAGVKQMALNAREFSDQHWEIEDIVAESDRVAVRALNHQYRKKERDGVPAGHTLTFEVSWFFRFDGDKIAEIWRAGDDLPKRRAALLAEIEALKTIKS